MKFGRSFQSNIFFDLDNAALGPVPRSVKPMLASVANKPFTKDDWIFEIKWDGWRAIGEVNLGKVRLYTRNDLTLNAKFPQIANELENLNYDAVFDGEIVVLGNDGKPNFQLLQNYKGPEGTLVYYVFDLIYFNGYDLRELALGERKKILRKIMPNLASVKISDFISRDGELFFEAVRHMGLEGIVAKYKKSRYLPGIRTNYWLKIKAKRTQEVVIGGYTEPRGSRKKIGALVIGVYEGKNLIFAGHCGSGFNDESLSYVWDKLNKFARKSSPFKNAPKTNMPVLWVEPKLVCEVEFTEWTREGVMRHPVFKGLRPDKNAQEVVREEVKQIKTDESERTDKSDKQKKQRKPDMSKRLEKESINKNLRFTHLDRIYFPEDKITKRDIIEYYKNIGQVMLPYIKDRPQSLYRTPEGIYGQRFYQKDIDFTVPSFVKTIPLYSESEDKEVNYMVCKNKESLLYMANLGCIEINPWLSRLRSLDKPDFCLIDLDPDEIAFDEVIKAALIVKDILESANIKSFPKTSGKTGIHILIPVGGNYTYEQVKQFAEIITILTRHKLPNTTSIERSPAKRKGLIYLDYLQNRIGQTMAAAYSLRPVEGAKVSTPLKWDEVNNKLDPGKFNIHSIFRRLSKYGDLMQGLLGRGINLEKSLSLLG